jgi:hypothetical protein
MGQIALLYPDQALSTFEALSPVITQKQAVASSVAQTLVMSGHDETAWKFVPIGKKIVGDFFAGLSAASPEKLPQYLSQISNAAERKEVVKRAIEVWPDSSIAKAGDFANSLAADPAFNEAATSLSERIRSQNPRDALVWAAAIKDGKLRVVQIKKVLNTAAHFDSELARELFQGLSLRPEERISIEKGVVFDPP